MVTAKPHKIANGERGSHESAIVEIQDDLYGNERRGNKGFIPRLEVLEEFMKRILSVENLIKGIAIGLGLNLITLFLIANQLFGWF